MPNMLQDMEDKGCRYRSSDLTVDTAIVGPRVSAERLVRSAWCPVMTEKGKRWDGLRAACKTDMPREWLSASGGM